MKKIILIGFVFLLLISSVLAVPVLEDPGIDATTNVGENTLWGIGYNITGSENVNLLNWTLDPSNNVPDCILLNKTGVGAGKGEIVAQVARVGNVCDFSSSPPLLLVGQYYIFAMIDEDSRSSVYSHQRGGSAASLPYSGTYGTVPDCVERGTGNTAGDPFITSACGTYATINYQSNIHYFYVEAASPPPAPVPPRNEIIFYTALVNETQNHTISVLLENYNITSASIGQLVYRSKVYGTTINHTNNSHVRFHGFPIAPLVVTNNTNQTFFFNYTLTHADSSIEKNQSVNLSHRIQHAYFLTGSQVFGGIETLRQNFNITMTSAHIANTELIGFYDGSIVTEFEDRTYGFIMNVTPPLITSNNTQLYANATLNVSYGYHNQYNLLRTPQTFNHWVLWIAWLKNATLSSTFTETDTVTETSYVERYNGLTLPFTPNLNYIFDNLHRPAIYSSNKFEINVTCPLIEFNHTTKAATVSMNMTHNGVTKTRALTMNTTPLNTSVDWGYWIVSSSTLSNITETVTQQATTTLNSFYKASLNLNYNYNEQYTASTNSSATNFITSLTAPRVTVATLINYSVDMNVTFNGITFVRNFTFS